MTKKLVSIIIVLTFLLVGCTSNQEYLTEGEVDILATVWNSAYWKYKTDVAADPADTATATNTAVNTATRTPTLTSTTVPTATKTNTALPTSTKTNTPLPTATRTPTVKPTEITVFPPTATLPSSNVYHVYSGQSLQTAVNKLVAGDTLLIHEGVYKESIYIGASGTSQKPINIMGYPGETVIVDGDNYRLPTSTWGVLFRVQGSYVNVSNIEVRNSNWMGVLLAGEYDKVSNMKSYGHMENGILITGNYGIVEDSIVHDSCLSNKNGVQTRQGWASGLTAARRPTGAIIRRNVVYNIWGEGISTYEAFNTTIEDNIVYNSYSANIYLSDTTGSIAQRNFAYYTGDRPGSNAGIMMGDEKFNPASKNNTVINNIVYNSAINFYHWTNGSSSLQDTLIANNTFVNAYGSEGFRINCGTHVNARILNNLVVEDSGTVNLICGGGLTIYNNLWSRTPSTPGTNYVVGNPLFEKGGDPFSPDWYRLLPDSPAINKALEAVENDYFKYNRFNLPDIGAIEYH